MLFNHSLQIITQCRIFTIHKTALLATCKQGFVSVEDEAAGNVVAGTADAGGLIVP